MEVLESYNGGACALAGGPDLLLKLKAGKAAPQAVVNLKRIPELRGIFLNAHLNIGALTTLEELRRSAAAQELFPALCDAAGRMASVQIRHLATVGGNICNAAPSADL